MPFPAGFKEKYQAILGSESAAFLASFEEEAVSAFRVNPLKEAVQLPETAQPIPGLPWSYYGKVSGKSLQHVTGQVYSQEPAAQMVVDAAGIEPGMKVLDLAAAPGGKSTHILSYLNNQGLLVANEIHPKRAKILVENLERFGARNAVVTNTDAVTLSKVFQGFFDVIVLDAPCSGEGMFRKQPEAMDYWAPAYPSQCASLQREILEAAVTMLAPDGRLVYSTCTWAPEENEAIVDWLLAEYAFDLEQVPLKNGMVAGLGQSQTARMYPHHFKGEGQFVARLHYQGANKVPKKKAPRSNLSAEQKKLWQAFEQEHLQEALSGVLQTFGEELYLLPTGLPALDKIRIARNGLHLGTFKKKRFEPSFALGMALKPSQSHHKYELPEEEFPAYVAGQSLPAHGSPANGWYHLVCGQNGLGYVKISQGMVKNHYPKGLRFQ